MSKTLNSSIVEPTTLLEAVRYYSDLKVCKDLLAKLRWPDGVECGRCGSKHVKELSTRQVWKCYGCKKQFSVKVGTIFEDSPLGLDKWFVCMWQIANCRNGVSSYEISRALKVKQETAWFMLHRVRHAMATGTFVKLVGVVESDETFIGGSEKNRHVTKQMYKRTGKKDDKAVVMGMVERGGRVVAKVVPNQQKPTITETVRQHVEEGATLYTDALHSYRSLQGEYGHSFVDHRLEYVRGPVHTNTIENFWSLLKRGIKGTYVSVDPFHLDRYVNEQAFRYNTRKTDDGQRFLLALARVNGRRLTYEQLLTLG